MWRGFSPMSFPATLHDLLSTWNHTKYRETLVRAELAWVSFSCRTLSEIQECRQNSANTEHLLKQKQILQHLSFSFPLQSFAIQSRISELADTMVQDVQAKPLKMPKKPLKGNAITNSRVQPISFLDVKLSFSIKAAAFFNCQTWARLAFHALKPGAQMLWSPGHQTHSFSSGSLASLE